MDWVIGGEKMAGQGWRMLMECLAAGPRHLAAVVGGRRRQVACCASPPPMPASASSSACRSAAWKGIEEPLARMVETAYVNEAARARHGGDGQRAARSRR